MQEPVKNHSAHGLLQNSANNILDEVISKTRQEKSLCFFHVIEHGGYGAILSRLMTGFNLSLELNVNYSFKIDSPYSIENLFDISFKKNPSELKDQSKVIEWNFFKDTWNAPIATRANHQFPRPPADLINHQLSRHEWCAILAKAICGKPLEDLQSAIKSTKDRLGWAYYDIVIGLHVRRGDKNTEAPYIYTDTYIHHLKKVAAQELHKKIAVFLTSDDPQCCVEFSSKLADENIDILWDSTEDRFNNCNAAMVINDAAMAKKESMTAAKNISLLGDCDYVIGMASAQFTWIGGLLSVFNHGLDTNRHIMIDAITNKQSHWACTYNFKIEDLLYELKKPESIKVLHISPDEDGGGAAKAAYRLHQAIQSQKINSEMLVLRKKTKDKTVKSVRNGILGKIRSKFYKKINLIKNKIDPFFFSNNPTLHSFGWSGYKLANRINQSDADIVHLHWISGMLSIDDIASITKPIVWTLHDMWAICGGEHYTPDDTPLSRFRAGYHDGNRPSYELGPDLNQQTWNAKFLKWKNKQFSIVGCSTWLANCAKDSPLFRNSKIYSVNFPLDVKKAWRPQPKELSRIAFNLPLKKNLILAGAVGGVNNFYKGGDLLKESLTYLNNQTKNSSEVILFGQDENEKFHDWPIPVHNVGKISNTETLVKLYSCADLVVMPSRQEAFGQIASEAQACGIPVVAFAIGGLLDIVEHQKTGWLSPPYDTKDLAHGMEWILNNSEKENISHASRERASKLFSEDIIGQKYFDIYKQVTISSL